MEGGGPQILQPGTGLCDLLSTALCLCPDVVTSLGHTHKPAPSPQIPRGPSSPASNVLGPPVSCPWVFPVCLLPIPETCGHAESLLTLISFGDRKVNSNLEIGQAQGPKGQSLRFEPWLCLLPSVQCRQGTDSPRLVPPTVKWGL